MRGVSYVSETEKQSNNNMRRKNMFRPEEIENGVTWDNGIRGSIFNGFNDWN